MVSWFYVKGSERVGPVDFEALKKLFLNEDLNNESYVWRKGFQNWERIKDVIELNFENSSENIIELSDRRIDKKQNETPIQKNEIENSLEIELKFNWNDIKEEDEIFFIKIGPDRKSQLSSKHFGPYSIIELKDAIAEKRITNHSLIFSAGMKGWIEVGDTPLDPKNFSVNTKNYLSETPLIIVLENNMKPVVALMDDISTSKCSFLVKGKFQIGNALNCSIYSGPSLKAKNLRLNIEDYKPMEQKVFCAVTEMSEDAKKVMLNYAE